MNGRLLTRRALPTLVAALSLGAVGTAHGSTAEVDPATGKLIIKGTAGEQNIITFERALPIPTDTRPDGVVADAYIVRDFNGAKPPVDYPFATPPQLPIKLVPLSGCTPLGNSEVRCTGLATDDGKITAIDADLNEGFDYLSPTNELDSTVAAITARGGASSDFLKGGDNADTLDGGAGDDTLQGFGSNDTLQPGQGGNTIYGSSRDTGIDAGGAHDVVDYSTVDVPAGGNGVYVSLPTTAEGTADDGFNCFREPGGAKGANCDNVDSDIEDVRGTNGRDIVLAQANDTENVVFGLAGNDRIDTFGGNDKTDGGTGDNALNSGAGDDIVTATTNGTTLADGKNTAVTEGGVDTITFGGGADTVDAGDGNDSIDTGAGNDAISGGPGSESKILAGDGDDLVRGGLGADLGMDGGKGSDALSYDDKTDPVSASLNETNALYGTFCGDLGTTAQCEGDTIVADTFENLQGGSAGDKLTGSNIAVNKIEGNGGNDQLFGLEKDDTLLGGGADDILVGGAGADELRGGTGEGDFVSYEDRKKKVSVTLDGQKNDGENCPTSSNATCENDNLFPDIENIRGGEGNDYLEGADPNNDQSISGNNRLEGLLGDDTLQGKLGSDTMLGGEGSDGVSYAGRTENLRVTLDGAQDDGSSTDVNSAAASTERDLVGADVENVTTGSGSDLVVGSASANELTTNDGNDAAIGNAGNDAINLGAGNDSAAGGAGNDGITGAAGDDSLLGNEGDDSADGGAGNDVIDGGFGADTMIGGDGTDRVEYGGRNADTLVIADLDGGKDDGQAAPNGASEENDTIAASVENLKGGAERNFFTGSPEVNVLDGGDNDDRLSGGARNDTLLGGVGNDVLHGDSEDDTLDGGAGSDDLHGDGGFDTADYRTRSGAVTVTRDEEFNDGEAGENDNVRDSTEDFKVAGDSTSPDPAPVTPTTTTTTTEKEQAKAPVAQEESTTGSSTTTTTVSPTTEQRDSTTATKQGSAIEMTSTLVRKGATRSILVRGRILVKARQGLAQTSAACKGGGKVLVTITKGRTVVGKRVVTISRTCGFLAPVTLKKATTGKHTVQVRFLGNSMLKATKRTTSLQVNG